MNNLPQIFNYQDKQVRTVLKDGQPWFAARDICDILEITDAWTVTQRLSDSMKGTDSISTPGGNQEMIVVNEAGIYKLVFTSRKPEAEKFTDWLASDVLPSIRKYGMYAKDELLDNPDLLLDVVTKYKEERDKNRLLEQRIALDKPKVDFFDAVADSKTAIDMGNAAKVLNFGKGRTTLFKILREKGILNKDNVPYQEYIDRGYFRTIEQKYTKPDGTTHISIKTLVYQKGLEYIRKHLVQAV